MIPPMLLQALQGMGQQQGQSPIDVQGLFNPIGQAIEAQQPYQEAVPQGPNPFASMGSIFAGTLADMLGAHGAQANAQNRLAERQAMPIEAQQRNTQRSAEMDHQKQMQRLQFKEQVAEARFKVAQAANDHDAMDKANKDAIAAKKEQTKSEQDFELLKQRESLAGQLKVAQTYAGGKKETTEEKQAAADEKADKDVLKFNADINNILSKPGSSQKGGKVNVRFGRDTEIKPGLTPAGMRQIQAHSSSVAKGATSPKLRDAALTQYIDTLRDPDTGAIDQASPAFKRFVALFQQTIPTVEERQQFLDSLGIQ